MGLGIADLDAIRVSALANNAPVSFGALGAPIIGLAAVTGLPLLALSSSIGNFVAVLALLPPWVLIFLVSGWEGVAEAWPLAIVASFSYIAGQWPVAHYLGPYLPDSAERWLLSGSCFSSSKCGGRGRSADLAARRSIPAAGAKSDSSQITSAREADFPCGCLTSCS